MLLQQNEYFKIELLGKGKKGHYVRKTYDNKFLVLTIKAYPEEVLLPDCVDREPEDKSYKAWGANKVSCEERRQHRKEAFESQLRKVLDTRLTEHNRNFLKEFYGEKLGANAIKAKEA